MIVISGALVLVALVLLVIGLIGTTLTFVYASIAVSLASFAFLIFGILQRRKETLPPSAGAGAGVSLSKGDSAPGGTPLTVGNAGFARSVSPTDEAEGITTVSAVYAPPVAGAAPAAAEDDRTQVAAATVLVVAGRPRHHVAGCRYLAGKDAETVDVADARQEGFTACGVCQPDAVDRAAGRPQVPTAPLAAVEEPSASPATVANAPRAATVKAPVNGTQSKAAAGKAAPVKAAKAVPTAASTKRGGVFVIPDRGKFHTPSCRYVRAAEGALELTKAAATKQGYVACGVCNP